jgi:hypothetical protein
MLEALGLVLGIIEKQTNKQIADYFPLPIK